MRCHESHSNELNNIIVFCHVEYIYQRKENCVAECGLSEAWRRRARYGVNICGIENIFHSQENHKQQLLTRFNDGIDEKTGNVFMFYKTEPYIYTYRRIEAGLWLGVTNSRQKKAFSGTEERAEENIANEIRDGFQRSFLHIDLNHQSKFISNLYVIRLEMCFLLSRFCFFFRLLISHALMLSSFAGRPQNQYRQIDESHLIG